MKICIYKIINPSGKIYVGKTKDYESRIKYYNNLYCKEQRKLYNSLKKYGPDKHQFEVIEECLFEELNQKEIFWIKKLKCVEKGLNLSYGGDGGNHTKESIELSRLSRTKPILQYDLEGNFIKEWVGANEACNFIGYGNPNNINDCARGKYQSTYGYRWKYKKDIPKLKLDPIQTHLPTTKFKIYINNDFKGEYISWKEIKKLDISNYILNKCNHSINNEYYNNRNKTNYKIIKESL